MLRLVDHIGRDFEVASNFSAVLRSNGKIVPGSHRDGHNVFTIAGRNWLSKLIAWQTIGGLPTGDIPFTHRRIRWIGVGVGSQFEVTTVSSLAVPVKVNTNDFLAPLDSSLITFPTSTSVMFYKEFGANEISFSPGPAVPVSEAALFVDVNPWSLGGTEDVAAPGETTTLDPQLSTNPPVAYKSFEPLPKDQNFTLAVRWEFRF